MYGEKIKKVREWRNFTQEYMADQLGIAQNTYSKLETNQTKLSVDALEKIAQVLDVSPLDILTQQPSMVNLGQEVTTSENDKNGQLYAFQKEFIEKMVASKDNEIQQLKEIITDLIKDKQRMFEQLKK